MHLLILHADGDAEGEAAVRWASGQPWTVDTGAPRTGMLPQCDVVWIHGDRSLEIGAWGDAVRRWVADGGAAVLSLAGVLAANALGAPGPAPHLIGPSPWRHEDDPLWSAAFRDWPEYPHLRGLQGWGEHPLFDGFRRGAYTWAATEGESVAGVVFRKPDWPDGARVVAVERAYVQLAADIAVAWEYDVGRGRLLCLGAHLRFTSGDRRFAAHRDRLVANALRDAATHTAGGASRTRTYWPAARRQHAAVTVLPRPKALAPHPGPNVFAPAMRSDAPDEAPFTLAGHAGLVVGSEARGVLEIWLHPLCVMSDVEVLLDGTPARCTSVRVTAGDITRTLHAPSGARVIEHVVLHAARREAHIQLLPAADGGAPTEIEWRCRLPLRLEWPMPVAALVPMRTEVAADGARGVVLVTGRDPAHLSALFVDGASVPPVVLAEEDGGSLVQMRSLDEGGLRLAIVATIEGREALSSPGSCAHASHSQETRLRSVHERSAVVTTGDATVDVAWPWAMARLANFMADGPYGRGMMAGYGASKPGWGRSRPGYAWFFGRDACWSLDALLPAGLHDEARDAISLLIDSADITGKIAHEITTSGVVHYDAADSTPLLLRAVCAYSEWTGDGDTVRNWWPAVVRALEFCHSCDRDGDGLPENSGVGHGWVEMGPLGGGATTSYTAAIWIDALRRLPRVARAVDDTSVVSRLEALRLRAEAGLAGLRDPDTGRLALHRRRDGSLATELTALAAVPIALGVDTSASAGEILHALGEPRFTAPWGLRMLPVDDARYDPSAYHAGAVWPLFTGWAALADARVGAATRAFERVRTIAALVDRGCKGAFGEVLHGDTGAAAGICPDQAWSAAMLIAPLMTGVLGVRPNAMEHACSLAPRLPDDVDQLGATGVRVGDRSFSIVCQRMGDRTELLLGAAPENPGDLSIDVRGAPCVLRPGSDLSVTLPADD